MERDDLNDGAGVQSDSVDIQDPGDDGVRDSAIYAYFGRAYLSHQ
jgi:hypothetical protein